MSAATYNLVINQGSDWSIQLTMSEDAVPVDLSGYSARAQIRTRKNSATLIGTFDCVIIDAVNGILTMSLANAVSTAITPGVFYYDLEIFTASDATVTRLIQGIVKIDTEVTR